MLKFERPKKPEDFQEKADIETKKIEEQLANISEKLNFNDSFWGKYKNHFVKAQHGKCGYCELRMSSYGDMEHYRPKSVVEELKITGFEREDLMNVSGRTFAKSCKYGYWWLAYDWDNYLLSCTLCNQPWKRALFPILEGRPENEDFGSEYPHKSPVVDDKETPLLLNPYDDIELSEHLRFNDVGLIEPFENSEFGKQTIITCGLDRLSLFQARTNIASITRSAIEAFAGAEDDVSARSSGKLILLLGGRNGDFAGMVRIMFVASAGGASWQDLESFVNQD
jgi:hypothetical protein